MHVLSLTKHQLQRLRNIQEVYKLAENIVPNLIREKIKGKEQAISANSILKLERREIYLNHTKIGHEEHNMTFLIVLLIHRYTKNQGNSKERPMLPEYVYNRLHFQSILEMKLF
ncbi:hypothetical protein SAMN06296036_10284 [Pseudobacteriovorax antillogorgiicola]|uniref:Uncharacterized protein n=1 Tax=Pseudobacteriovorax antillogorgiicola TaxID=1513793 RepID=A0A1Y6BAH7_9BACT|nr:hypothetical protein EDD56_102359 [Pseudobacteriovorax antillogorgiicola]SME94071.1 hypothetical protein SAMN06296036_10284 [Pseudobacteriovorax antillogorgiicola]